MKIEAYESLSSNDIKAKLENTEDGISLRIVNEKGENVQGGLLLNLTAKGLYLYPSVGKRFGLNLDGNTRLKVIYNDS